MARTQLQSAAGASAVRDLMSHWDGVMNSESVSTYHAKWKFMQHSYRREDYQQSIRLLLREQVNAPWGDKHLHLGATVRLRVEDFYSVLKNLLSITIFQLKLLYVADIFT